MLKSFSDFFLTLIMHRLCSAKEKMAFQHQTVAKSISIKIIKKKEQSVYKTKLSSNLSTMIFELGETIAGK